MTKTTHTNILCHAINIALPQYIYCVTQYKNKDVARPMQNIT